MDSSWVRGVHLRLELVPIEVLLGDFDQWHAVLNYEPLVSSDEEWEVIVALPETARAQAVEVLWTRIFDLAAPLDPYCHDGRSAESHRTIQAVFEQLRLNNVV